MKRLAWFILLGCLALAWAIAYRTAPPPPEAGPADERIVRAYDVADLLELPLFEPLEPDFSNAPTFPPGRFEPQETPEQKRLNELMAMIEGCVDPGAWTLRQATVTAFGKRLVVVQTRENHRLIAALLNDLRTNPPPQVHIEAVWAALSADEVERVTVTPRHPGASPIRAVDLPAVERIAGAIAYRAESTCTSGSGTSLIVGRARTALTGVEATFGGVGQGATLVGRTERMTDGATLSVVPCVGPDGRSVLLSLSGDVRRFAADGPPIDVPTPTSSVGASAKSMKLDRLNFGAQGISTTVRGPLGTALLVGGSVDPDRPPGDARRLYLIVRASLRKSPDKQ